MIVMFNTFDPCSDSYISASYLNSNEEYPCKQEMIEITGPIVPYLQQYVHRCDLEIDSASEVTEFRYKVETGQDEKTEDIKWEKVELSSVSLGLL